MASSGNFCTLNPLTENDSRMSQGNYSNGNLTYDDVGGDGWICNMAMTHKTYCEFRVDGVVNYGGTIGLRGMQAQSQTYDSVVFQANYSSGNIYHYKGDSDQSFSGNAGSTISAGNIVMMAYDPATYKWWVGVNGSWNGSQDPANGSNPCFTGSATMFENMNITWGGWSGDVNRLDHTWNFGQDSTFGGQETAGGNADENGFGDFKYTPPTGFLALCTGNMVISEELDPAEENQPAKYFDAVAYTGNGSTQNITGLGFQPDITLIKNRDQTDSWCHQNSTLGVGKTQAIDTAAAVASETDCVTAFNSDGFSLGNNHKVNASSENYIAYCWKKSADAGLDIVTYSGDGSTQAISHNLGVTPTMIWIFLNTGSNLDSICYIDSNNAPSMGTGNGIFMSLPNGKQASTYVSATSSSSFSVTSSANSSGRTYFAYVFAEKEGFSKFTEYEGFGNSDGPFIHNNFLGKLNIIKAIDSSQMWATTDTVRETFNPLGEKIIALDNTYAEFDASGFNYDMVSNGIKIRSSDTNINSSASFLSLSWASVPFKYNNTF